MTNRICLKVPTSTLRTSLDRNKNIHSANDITKGFIMSACLSFCTKFLKTQTELDIANPRRMSDNELLQNHHHVQQARNLFPRDVRPGVLMAEGDNQMPDMSARRNFIPHSSDLTPPLSLAINNPSNYATRLSGRSIVDPTPSSVETSFPNASTSYISKSTPT